eukprot:767405_1
MARLRIWNQALSGVEVAILHREFTQGRGARGGINRIMIQACDDWVSSSYSYSVTIKFQGTEGSSPYIPANPSALPTNGGHKWFDVDFVSQALIGDLYKVSLRTNDEDGYCMKRLIVANTHGSTWNVFDRKYFGDGVVLRANCDHSFMYISRDLPLLRCFDSAFELTLRTKRGIYDVKLHSCRQQGGGMDVVNMKNSLYLSMTGKKRDSNTYSSTLPIFLDHCMASGDINLDNLGTLSRRNVHMPPNKNRRFYSPI